MKNNQDEFYPVALTIAASDSGGGAGIQADLRTFNAAGVFGCSVVTAVVAQNPRQVVSVQAMSPELVKAQYEAVTSALAVKAIKVGMLPDARIIKTVCQCLQKNRLPLIVDPEMFSGSGFSMPDGEARQILCRELLPMASLITPNLQEAEWLLGHRICGKQAAVAAAGELAGKFNCNCLIKGSYTDNNDSRIIDVAVLDKKIWLLGSPRVENPDKSALHGIGSTLSSAVTAMLASGSRWKDALLAARAHVYGALSETALIGNQLEGMYPPLEDYSKYISMRPAVNVPGGEKGKGGLR